MRVFILASAALALSIALAVIFGGRLAGQPSATSAGVQSTIALMAIDLDTADNTATSLGIVECRRGEVSPDSTLDIDVVVANVPADRPIQGFDFDLLYDPARINVTAVNDSLLLAANAGSGPFFSFTDPVPDNDGSFKVANADFGTAPGETGPGVLARITIQILTSAASGETILDLNVTEVVDDNVINIPRDLEQEGVLGISVPVGENDCPVAPPPGPPPLPVLQGERGTAVLGERVARRGVSGVVEFAVSQADTDYTATFVGTDRACQGHMVTDKTTSGFRAVCLGTALPATIDWLVVR